jgi:hypothetical protein
MTDDFPPKILHVIPCTNPGLSCCDHRLVATGQPADNVQRCRIYCAKWRGNRFKDRVFHACDEGYAVQELAVIDAEEEQKNKFSLRDGK